MNDMYLNYEPTRRVFFGYIYHSNNVYITDMPRDTDLPHNFPYNITVAY